ncbi:hypothetical protein I3760_15G092100 [Carya illinoinensis]|nr:hypothetical protein I3760_15G092100 [Carya illinoinensis]
MKASQRSGWDVFTVMGFRNWKKINNGKHCAFLNHIGEDPCSCHNNAVKSCNECTKLEQILNNLLRVKTSIDVVRWLAFQRCAFRGHDETLDSKNRDNFLEMLKLLASYNNKVGKLVLENAPKSSKFVDVDGFIQERFFDLVHVKDTSALTLKNEISAVLSRHCLDIQNIPLFLKDYPYAYYVYCFAHRLQLALVAASREVISVHEFFSNLNFIINVVGASCKRHDELQAAQATHIAHMIAIDELETTCSVLETIKKKDPLALNEIMGITDVLCQVLQQKSQDILNAMNMVSTTKGLIQKLRNEKLSSRYIQGRGRHQRDHITIEHHYHFEIFNVVIDFQMQELDNRFPLDPKDGYKSFNIDDICCLAEEHYPLDFSENEKINLRFQLKHFEVDVLSNPKFQDLRSIANLYRRLVETEKSKIYYLIDRLIRLILTLPVSTATSERAFSVMKIVKTRLCNKIEDEFLANNLVVYIEREIVKNFDLNLILDDFVCLKERKLQF